MLLLVVAACSQDVTLEPAQAGCTDFDYDDPEASSLEVTHEGDDAIVTRTNVLMGSDLVFEPTIAADGNRVLVYEAWTGTAGEDDFCYAPSVRISGYTRKLQVQWFLSEDDDVPFDSATVEPG
jgi:hypothetical protein